MLIVISPAKTLDIATPITANMYSEALFLKDAHQLVKVLRKFKVEEIGELMEISPKLAQLNFDRFHEWHLPFTPENSKQALLAFKGDVYTGIDAKSFSDNDFNRAQTDLRILSGLYGILKPMDLIQAYRLEMGKKLENGRGKNLYEFWGDKITNAINSTLKEHGHRYLINLASSEYYKSIKSKAIKVEIITPAFKDLKNGQYKMISFFVKKARGLMTRFIIQNRINNPDDLKAFDLDGYIYNPNLSNENSPVFTRDH